MHAHTGTIGLQAGEHVSHDPLVKAYPGPIEAV